MAPMIEMLEDRRFLSASPAGSHHVEAAHHAAITAPVKQDPAFQFKGTAVNSDGKLCANLQITVRKTDAGYRIEITGNDPKGGKPVVMSGMLDSKGYFTCDGTDNQGALHVVGQVNTATKTVSGNWTETGRDGIKHGTFSATLVSTSDGGSTNPTPPAPPKPPAPVPAAVYHFQGTSTDDKGHVSPVTMTITRTSTGYRAELHVLQPGGSTQSIVMTVDASKHFVYDNTTGGVTLHIEGQISGDPLSITGSFTSTRADGSSYGTFTLAMAK